MDACTNNLDGLSLRKSPRVLDGMSELWVFSTYPEAKNIMMFGFDLEGPIAIECLDKALRDVIVGFPSFSSGVRQSKIQGSWRLTWFLAPDFQPMLRQSDMEIAGSSCSFQHSLLSHLRPSLEKDWDLLSTVPTEFHLIRYSQGRHTLLTLVHHAAADGWTLSEFYSKLFARYHELVTGKKPEWTDQSDYASSTKNQMVKLKRRRWRDAIFFAHNSLSRYVSKPSLPKGSGKQVGGAGYYAKLVLTPEGTDRVVGHVSKLKRPFIDALVGGMATAVDAWNDSLNIPRKRIVICVTVQMRGRFGEIHSPINNSAIAIKLSPRERLNPELLAKSASKHRKKQLDSLFDVRTWQAGCTLADAVRMLPLSAKRNIVHFVADMPLIPIMIAPFGILWPETKGGNRTGDSYLRQAGGLTLTDFHTMPYKMGYRCPLILGAFTFRKKLNLILVASTSHFTQAETDSFLKLLADVLVKNPFGCSLPA